MQAVMMVAGKSTRTYPLTLTRPKPLLPILNHPLIHYNLNELAGLVDEVILIVGYRREMIEAMIGSEYRGMKITYQEQQEQLGTGHAVICAKPHIRARFIVMNGDDLFSAEDIQKLSSFRYGALAMEVDDPSEYGVIQTDAKDLLVNFVEKPKTKISNLANIGCYVMEPDIFTILEKLPMSERGEIELPAAILKISKQEPVRVVRIVGHWLPTGFPWDMLKTQRSMFDENWKGEIRGTVEKGAMLNGEVQLKEGGVIRSGAHITGPVSIGRRVTIDPLCCIGPYTSIGHDVRIHALTVIEQSMLMNRCIIRAGAIVRHSVIGENADVGEGCHLISRHPDDDFIQSMVKGKWTPTGLRELGAILADDVHLSARAWILPGCKIWPGIRIAPGTKVDADVVK